MVTLKKTDLILLLVLAIAGVWILAVVGTRHIHHEHQLEADLVKVQTELSHASTVLAQTEVERDAAVVQATAEYRIRQEVQKKNEELGRLLTKIQAEKKKAERTNELFICLLMSDLCDESGNIKPPQKNKK